MNTPLLPLAAFLTMLAPLPGLAALVWTDHSTDHLYASTNIFQDGFMSDPERYNNPVRQMEGSLPSGGITSTYTTSNGYWINAGYKGSGPLTTYRPGYNPLPLDVPASPHGIPSAPSGSILEVRGYYNSTVTATSDFTGLTDGSLPAGSWIFLNFGDVNSVTSGDAVLTVTSWAGWNGGIWLPGGDQGPSLISATGSQLTFQGSGTVYLRTSQPLTSLNWTVVDPTPYLDVSWGQYSSYTRVSYGIVANIPEPSVTAGSLLAAGCFLLNRGRRRG